MSDNFPLMSTQIYNSREQIRRQLTEYIKEYLDLQDVDLTKTSFVSYIINVLSSQTSNLLFYTSSVYREFFLTLAQLPESVLNLASFIGYSASEATHSNANVLIRIPFGFEDSLVEFSIPEGFKFFANEIVFSTYYTTNIRVFNNSSASVTLTTENKVYNIPVNIDTTTDMEFSIILPLRQYTENIQEFQIDGDLRKYQFVNLDVPVSGKVSGIKVEIREPDSTAWEEFQRFSSIYLMSSTDTGYVARRSYDGIKIYFGNGLIGKQPKANATVKVTIRETLGADGNVIAGAINRGERIYTTTITGKTQILNYFVLNISPASGGKNEETIDETRRNAIDNLTSRNRLVSENDYNVIKTIIPNAPILESSIPILKRSDLKINEIQIFTIMTYSNDAVPTRNIKTIFPLGTTFIPKNTIIEVDGEEYYTLFDMTLDTESYFGEGISSVFDHFHRYLTGQGKTLNAGFNYVIGSNSIELYRNGILLNKINYYGSLEYGDYLENSASTIYLKNISPVNGDIFQFRLSLSTNYDTLKLLSGIETESNSITITEFQLSRVMDIKVFLNGKILIENINYEIDYTNNILNFTPGLLNVDDVVRVRMLDIPEVLKFSHVVTNTDMLTKLISLPNNYNVGDDSLEVYKNGVFMTKMRSVENYNGLYGHYYEISQNQILFKDGVLSLGDVLYFKINTDIADMRHLTNDYIEYSYILSELQVIPNLTSTYDIETDLICDRIEITRDGAHIIFDLFYYTDAEDYENYSCTMAIVESEQLVNMTNIPGEKKFRYIFNNYLDIPEKELTYNFTIANISELIVSYSAKIIVRQSLNMMSNVKILDSEINAYDIPVIKKSFYDSVDIKDFESLTLQSIISEMEFINYRMLTDFINLKLANTTGTMYTMQYNTVSKQAVKDLILELPTEIIAGERFIVKDCAEGPLEIYKNKIIEWSGSFWNIQDPLTNDIIMVTELGKKVIFNGFKWVIPIYELPIQIELEVVKQRNYSGNIIELSNNIKDVLIESFSPQFGLNKDLRRSEIIKTVQNIDGVDFCHLIKPESDIFFKFDLNLLQEEELLEYTPAYIHFSEENITVRMV